MMVGMMVGIVSGIVSWCVVECANYIMVECVVECATDVMVEPVVVLKYHLGLLYYLLQPPNYLLQMLDAAHISPPCQPIKGFSLPTNRA